MNAALAPSQVSVPPVLDLSTAAEILRASAHDPSIWEFGVEEAPGECYAFARSKVVRFVPVQANQPARFLPKHEVRLHLGPQGGVERVLRPSGNRFAWVVEWLEGPEALPRAFQHPREYPEGA